MNRFKKIINDPVYGFIGIPEGLLFELMEHPYFQRLRFIKQIGLSHFVYPGAFHTRFHHALGTMHLALKITDILRSKGINISNEEEEALAAAMLLHDIGHGPFSHALENLIIDCHHEDISLMFIKRLNDEFGGRLSLCIDMFENRYHRSFFNQLICSQLDLDRIDYLGRDAYFTGVVEGRVGYDRILHMLNVRDQQLVVEEKGIISIEKFLFARKLMFWQVYLHKTVLSAEQMLIKLVKRTKSLLKQGHDLGLSGTLIDFLSRDLSLEDFKSDKKHLETYAQLDDIDVSFMIKSLLTSEDKVCRILADSLINRRLFQLDFFNEIPSDLFQKVRLKVANKVGVVGDDLDYLVFTGTESNTEYKINKEEILILRKNEMIEPISFVLDLKLKDKALVKKYLCFMKY